MCIACGCGMPDAQAANAGADHRHAGHAQHDGHQPHAHPHGPHEHAHEHAQEHAHERHHHDAGAAPAGGVPAHGDERLLRVERDLLAKNDGFARANRRRLNGQRIFALNLVSSPGSGKTSLLVRTIDDLKKRFAITVIEGDQQTARDAERIRATGVPAVQVNTGKGCHLDAHMVAHALDELAPAPGGLLFIENVGNLICPALFDLGEAHKVIVLSVTEGEDKPLKYPDMFAAADLMLVNKSDLLPHLEFDLAACLANAIRVNPRLQTLVVSARTGEGMAAFYAWIEARAAQSAAAPAGC